MESSSKPMSIADQTSLTGWQCCLCGQGILSDQPYSHVRGSTDTVHDACRRRIGLDARREVGDDVLTLKRYLLALVNAVQASGTLYDGSWLVRQAVRGAIDVLGPEPLAPVAPPAGADATGARVIRALRDTLDEYDGIAHAAFDGLVSDPPAIAHARRLLTTLPAPAPADAREAGRERVYYLCSNCRRDLADCTCPNPVKDAISKALEFQAKAATIEQVIAAARELARYMEGPADYAGMAKYVTGVVLTVRALDAAARPESAGLFPDMPEPMRSTVLSHLDAREAEREITGELQARVDEINILGGQLDEYVEAFNELSSEMAHLQCRDVEEVRAEYLKNARSYIKAQRSLEQEE